MGHTQETCNALHGLPQETCNALHGLPDQAAQISKSEKFKPKFSSEEYH